MSDEKLSAVHSSTFKADDAHIEHANAGRDQEGRLALPPRMFTKEEEAKLYRKIDIKDPPLYDRGNIGNARLVGLEADLGMSGSQYAVALSVFFVTYCLFEIPSNLCLSRFRPSLWITLLTFSWGLVMTLMGVVQNYAGLVVCRLLLGATEAGLFPGVVLLLTFWYPRDLLQRRVALFFSAATLAGAFSGLLAYAIGFMDGVGNYRGWRWIFILEGLMTILAGVLAYFVMVDRPEQAGSWLTPEEKAYVIWRKESDGSSVGEAKHISWKYVKAAFSDFQCWCALGYYTGVLTALYGVGLFTPSLINSFGTWTRPQVQLLTVPVYLAACAYVLVTAVYADRLKTRFPFLLAAQLLCLVGFTINLTPAPVGVKFFGLILCAMGAYGGVPAMITWLTGNLSGQAKRGVGSALTLGLGSLGGVASSNIYRSADAPRYFLGHGVELGLTVLGICCSCLYAFLLTRANKAKEAEQARQDALPEHEKRVYTVKELQDLGDKAPEFVYTV
ncbi:MFS general substrate transporter [Leucosporidium creatinivorum]|uniref:MFS general substrate transporter n=1 Tax=Leucosporidium creatinivorum TaxID=106004 RepID=A0A1Y2FXX7_9BASI|nr:MFS general substrate transporter [Leucosporidium creatinivorum]